MFLLDHADQDVLPVSPKWSSCSPSAQWRRRTRMRFRSY